MKIIQRLDLLGLVHGGVQPVNLNLLAQLGAIVVKQFMIFLITKYDQFAHINPEVAQSLTTPFHLAPFSNFSGTQSTLLHEAHFQNRIMAASTFVSFAIGENFANNPGVVNNIAIFFGCLGNIGVINKLC